MTSLNLISQQNTKLRENLNRLSGKIYADGVLEGVNIWTILLEIMGDLEAVITERAHYTCGNTCPRKIKMESWRQMAQQRKHSIMETYTKILAWSQMVTYVTISFTEEDVEGVSAIL